jgi:hypothetical protein
MKLIIGLHDGLASRDNTSRIQFLPPERMILLYWANKVPRVKDKYTGGGMAT